MLQELMQYALKIRDHSEGCEVKCSSVTRLLFTAFNSELDDNTDTGFDQRKVNSSDVTGAG